MKRRAKIKTAISFTLVAAFLIGSLSSMAAGLSLTAKQISSLDARYDQHGWVQKQNFSQNDKTLVKGIQVMLNDLMNANLDEDGVFGPATAKFVKQFQKRYGLDVDGCVGTKTWNKMVALYKAKLGSTASTNTSKVATPPASEIHVCQTPGTCTAAACAMLARADKYLKGVDYSTVTLNKIMNYAWISGQGLRLSFWVDGSSIKAYSLSGSAAQKQAKVANLLKSHPEGIVLYGWNSNGNSHAVYMNKDMKILDPYYSSKKYINLSDSASSASDSFSDIKQYWIVVN